MTVPTCRKCGVEEQRTFDPKGRPLLNLNPITLLCVDCTVAEAASGHTFHSRAVDRLGEVVDVKANQARNDDE